MTDDRLRDLMHDLSRHTQAELYFDTFTRVLYSTDASIYQILPLGVVIPRTEEDVIATVEACARYRVPILPRGGGSSLAGQAVGEAIVIDMSKYLNRILHLDPEARTVTVQPGLVLAHLNKALHPHGLMFGPDPASGERATLGGMAGNNSAGAHSILYGMTIDHVQAADVVLADGSTARFEAVDGATLEQRAQGNSLEARLYREVPALLREVADEIRTRFPKHWRRSSGYSLNYLLKGLEEGRFNLTQGIVGSEGTLAVVRSLTLNLVERPKRTGLCVVHCDDLIQAMHVSVAALECDPSAVELMDHLLLTLARQVPAYARHLSFVQGDPQALIMVEFYGEDEREIERKIEHLENHLRRKRLADTFVRALTPEQQAQVWYVRKVGLGLLMGIRGDHKPIPFIEDAAVPPQHLPDYIGAILDLMRETDTRVAMYAHASAGCIHVRPLINLKDARDVEKMAHIADVVADLVIQYGGAISGEHGDGLVRSPFNERLFGPTLYEAMRRFKAIFDPHTIMNPGKVVDPPPMTENLRYGTDYRVRPFPARLNWDDFLGFDRAVEQCNGAGVCRKIGAGTMCPTFMATRDERDSTRGRANALRAWLSGKPLAPEEDDVYAVLDLCLGCKACKAECPSAVDMNKIKTEWTAWYYERHGLPLRNRFFGEIHRLSVLASKVAPLANATLRIAPVRALFTRALGIHPNRRLPEFAGETFLAWWRKHTPARNGPAPRGPVILFPDTFLTYNDPHIGRAAVRLLEAAGYEVIVPERLACCGRPLLSQGMLERARENAAYNVSQLAAHARAGIPIVGVEPSCILTVRDEYPDLVEGEDARAVAEASVTIDEFLADLLAREPDALRFAAPDAAVYVHGHCHQKALVGTGPTLSVLRAAGFQVEEIPSGCCGMAGSFGYEAEHYDLSVKIAEDRLLPTLREAPKDAIVIADGTSCRHQIADLSDRRARHLVEVLAEALISERTA